MSPTAKASQTRQITDRTVAPQMTVNGRHVATGDEITVDGIRGRCAFIQHVTHTSGVEWVDVITSRGFSRSVRPDVIRTAHQKRRLGLLR